MAAASALVSEDNLLCPVCLSVFIKPVSIPCGHNFCLDCITACWHTLSVLQCPLCKEKFHTRPLLRVNTIIAEMAEKVKSVQEMILSSAERAGNEDVLCSICVGAKVKALKSCLMCLVSYCQTHLEPHQRILALKKHKLIDPVKNLESRICRDHGEPLELICRLDQMFLCQSCKCSDHKTHETVALEDEAEMRKTQLRLENNSMDQFIQEHEQKIQELQQSVKTSRSKAEEALLYSRKVMTALVQHIKTEFTRLSEAIEIKQKINETEAESFMNELEGEITHIKKKKLQFHEALLIRDPFRFLENVLPLTYNKPQLKDWSAVTVTSDQFMIQETMTELETAVREEVSTLCDINFRDGKQQRNNLEDLTYVKEYQPNVSGIKHLRVLIYGPVGSGKSSFINSVSSVLRGRISVPALTSTSDRNFTIKYETYKIRKGRGSSATVYPVVFNDTMGLEEGVNCGIHPDDIKLAMQGHVKDGYRFNPIAPLSERDPAYNPTPTADDKVHVLVCVLSGNASEIKLSVLEKMNRVQQLARYLGIPQMAVITKIDEVCPETEKNLRNVYKSKYLKKKMKAFSSEVGMPMNCIFPVKNDSNEIDLNEAVDTLILSALEKMIDFGNDYIEKL